MSDEQVVPDCRECWLTGTVQSQAEQLRRAWSQLNERQAEPARRWWVVFALGCVCWLGGMIMMAWMLSPQMPRFDGAVGYTATPTDVMPLVNQSMAIAPHESVELRRDGPVIRMFVLYDGVVRGQLLRLDTVARTLEVPARPPFQWSIGGL